MLERFRAVLPWAQTTGIASSVATTKVSGTRASGSIGFRLRNTGLVSLYIVEVRAGSAAPTVTSVTTNGQYVALLPAGSVYESGLSDGDVYCLAASSTGSCQFQEIVR